MARIGYVTVKAIGGEAFIRRNKTDEPVDVKRVRAPERARPDCRLDVPYFYVSSRRKYDHNLKRHHGGWYAPMFDTWSEVVGKEIEADTEEDIKSEILQARMKVLTTTLGPGEPFLFVKFGLDYNDAIQFEWHKAERFNLLNSTVFLTKTHGEYIKQSSYGFEVMTWTQDREDSLHAIQVAFHALKAQILALEQEGIQALLDRVQDTKLLNSVYSVIIGESE